MKKRLILIPLAGLLLVGCALRAGNRLFGGGGRPTAPLSSPTDSVDAFPTEPPTATPAPTATITPTPTPDFSVIGLPAESAAKPAYDFAANICAADWSTNTQSVPCDGQDPETTSGYVGLMGGSDQGVPPNISVLVMYPPQGGEDTLSGTFPAFTIQKGDRFRAVLGCRAHNFCDVDFGLDYYTANGKSGLKHWTYLFTDAAIVVDYPLDGLAGMTVRFSLSVRRHGEGLQAYAVWLAPHIYRP